MDTDHVFDLADHGESGTVITPEDLVEQLLSGRQHITERALQGAPGAALAKTYSDIVDEIIRQMFRLAHRLCGHTGRSGTVPVAIVATGGYGRRELCPHSDVDITFIPRRDGDAATDRVVKEMFNLLMKVLMDQAKIEVGYAYRLVEDCGRLDHQTVSGLLDARLIAGDRQVFLHFENEFWDNFNAAEFIFAKLEERRKRHRTTGPTFRVVEPDIKNGQGGLRDFQTAVWLIQAKEGLPGGEVRGDRCWRVLTQRGWLSERQVAELKRSREFLFRVRNAMHTIAGREADQVTTGRQEEVARILGYDSRRPHEVAVERFMHDLYDQLSLLYTIGDEIADRVENSRLYMGIGLDCVERQLVPATPLLASEDPVWTVWAAYLAQLYELRFSYDLRRAASEVARANPTTQEPERLGEVFTDILRSTRPVYPTLQLMADTGILAWLMPDYAQTLHLIPYDPAHDFTVGQHALYAIQYLDELRFGPVGDDLRELHMLMAELTTPEQLYLATLLHDVGKAEDGRPHWETGAEAAERVCSKLGWSQDATENVVFLVRHHLLMAETSRLRDLTLPETIRDFTSVVSDRERLRMLYLLTYADTRAVSAGQWTQVKARFLQELYHRAEHALLGGSEPQMDEATLTRTRKRLMRELSVDNVPPEEVSAHLDHMPAHYVLNTRLEDIALHIAFARTARTGVPAISFHDDRYATFTELTICTLDDPQPGLLAKIAGVLYTADLTVHAAQVYTRVEGDERIALDTLYVDYRGKRLPAAKRTEVENNLRAVLSGTKQLEDVLSKRRDLNDRGNEPSHLRIINTSSPTFTIVETGFPNPQGVLFYSARALARLGWDIHSARLSRFRGQSMATFYVTGAKHLAETEAYEKLKQVFETYATRTD